MTSSKKIIENKQASLTVDLYGGAIVDFHLIDEEKINPLSFAFSKDQMPENNKEGAVYQGHFLCLPRWGEPSEREIKKGVPNHGSFANIVWSLKKHSDNSTIEMTAVSELEQMQINRSICLIENKSVFHVNEEVINTASLGRLYNIVQHPTMAAPFLNISVIIYANAAQGFQQLSENENKFTYPYAVIDNNTFNISEPQKSTNGVFSFIVNKDDEYGWIAVYNASLNLLIGYVWKRKNYPWMHIWQQFAGSDIKYLGTEFGTAGLHQPFEIIIDRGVYVLDTPALCYLDAGERITRSYACFLFKPEKQIEKINEISLSDDESKIIINFNNEQTTTL